MSNWQPYLDKNKYIYTPLELPQKNKLFHLESSLESRVEICNDFYIFLRRLTSFITTLNYLFSCSFHLLNTNPF
jgi:hypothetical protein